MFAKQTSSNRLSRKGQINLFQVFPWVWLVAAYILVFLVFGLLGRTYIDSDMASEMVLADLLNKEGGLLSTNWWYSTEIKLCSLQMYYQIGLKIFPNNWYAARIFGQAILMLLFLAVYLYVGHGLKLKNYAAWGAAALACPFGLWYLWYGAFGGFYITYMVWILLSFGAMLHLLEKPTKLWYALIHGGILALSSMISGLNSVKGMMVFYVPMVIASLVIFVLRWNSQPQECPQKEKRLVWLSIIALFIAAIGYFVNSSFLAQTHHFYDFNEQCWSALSITEILNNWSLLLSLFGYPTDAFFDSDIPLFSVTGILGAFGVLIAGAIVFSIVRLLYRWKKLQGIQLLIPVLFASICIVQGIIFGCTGSSGASPKPMNASYWLTTIPFVLMVLQLEGETEGFRLKFTRKFAAIAFCVCFVATSVGSTMQFFSHGYHTNPHLEEVCDWLTTQGYTQGYSTFWNGNVLTEWSSGQIEMWVTQDFNTMKPYKWLQKASHSEPPEGEVFIITTKEELESMNLSQLYWWSNVVYEEDDSQATSEVGHYLVMTYKNYDDMMNAIHGAQSWEQEAAQETQDTQSA